MNREIKFRGKRKDINAWAYGDLLQNNDGSASIRTNLNTWRENHDDVDAYGDNLSVDIDTVGQFTGLYDKNKKEIYEGDILGTDDRVIGWIKGGVRGYCYDVIFINHPAGEKDWPLYGTVKHDFPGKIKVIGNIYDNPELLKP